MSSMKLERWLRTTPPIFVVRDGYLSCEDVVGFASVGSGSRHAESQMMLARHAWNADLDPTLLTTYLAKKRAEVAPGVGTETDMFMITGPGNNFALSATVMGSWKSFTGSLPKRKMISRTTLEWNCRNMSAASRPPHQRRPKSLQTLRRDHSPLKAEAPRRILAREASPLKNPKKPPRKP